MEKIVDYYKILNLPKNAGKIEIKNAYKKLVKQYHPDLYKGDKNFAEQKIKEINEAYSILSNPEKKQNYDEILHQMEHSNISYTSTPEVSYEPSDNHAESPFTTFLTEKLNHLSTKRQLQIFIVIFMLTLLLFLINLIQLKEHFTPQTPRPTTNSVHIENITNSQFQKHNDFHYYENFEHPTNSLDDLFNNYMKSYFEESDKY